jgi:formylglycine-generating enzyme required for sulfatase activity/serine/threonine protein kinase
MPNHLTDADLQRFHAGEMNPDEKAQLVDHLAQCGECSERNGKLLKSHDDVLAQARGIPATMSAVAPPPSPTPSRPDRVGPYRILEEIGEGGMGTVFLAEQTEPIRRRVALKIIKLGMDTKSVIARFEAERQALAMMEHPNVARILDAGTTPEGRPYFVMEHVQGERITDYCDRHRLTMEARLGLFMDVCHAVQHAHQKAIIHRDIKPSNILVTVKDGKPIPKVIDFGVAKATEQKLTESTVYTEQGQLIGTPEYMSPEQAEMTALNIDTRTDIYSLGVLLYELLVGTLPFDSVSLRGAGYAEIQRIIREVEPPRPSTRLSALNEKDSDTAARRRASDLSTLVRHLRGDLDWVIMKALEKDRTRRYETANGMAMDIHRYLKNEAVIARPPSTSYRVRKFVRKNRGLVIGTVIVVFALSVGLVATALQWQRAEDNEQEARLAAQGEREAAARERDARVLADANAQEANLAKEEVLRLADLKRLADARAAADDLWPAHPENIEAMKTWLHEEAGPLRDNLPKHRATLATLRDQALEYDPEQQRHDRETHRLAGELSEKKEQLPKLREQLEKARVGKNEDVEKQAKEIADLEQSITDTGQRIDELESTVQERRTWQLNDDAQQWQHDTLAGLVVDLEAFVDEDPKKGALAGVEERLDFARTIEEQSITGSDVAAAWAEAIADIGALEVYGGLRLRPQLGLQPLRRDPRSGLWEFWHLQTGTRPEPNPDAEALNRWILSGDTGLVFVLIPGGSFQMGAQKDDPEAPNHDPGAEDDESPVHEITLDPYFISKYEMTQGQWLRFTGSNPSNYGVDWKWGEEKLRPDGTIHENTAWNPVEHVSWIDCTETLERMALALPTEAQWEYAARAGTTTVWWTGDDKVSIGAQRAGNLADAWTKSQGGPATWDYQDWEDNWGVHASAGSFAPNPFGLHDTLGNVWEWARDWHGSYEDDDVEPGSGLRKVFGARARVYRGGSFSSGAAYARSAYRSDNTPESRSHYLGVRPSAPLRLGPQ